MNSAASTGAFLADPSWGTARLGGALGYNRPVEREVRPVCLCVEPLPRWLDAARLLGTEAIEWVAREDGLWRVQVQLLPNDAALVLAQLRGLGIDGRPLEVRVEPALPRSLVRAGRLAEARARRETSPGFLRPQACATGEGRYSLTPEALAFALGERAGPCRVVEACAGSGGNSIGFARAGAEVTAFEIAPERVAEARHNARVYGVEDRIRLVLADALQEVPACRADLLFIDPPWGEHYDKRRTERADFPLLDQLLRRDLSGFLRVWLKVPSSFAVDSVPGCKASAWFGVGTGDARRIKFFLLEFVPERLYGARSHVPAPGCRA